MVYLLASYFSLLNSEGETQPFQGKSEINCVFCFLLVTLSPHNLKECCNWTEQKEWKHSALHFWSPALTRGRIQNAILKNEVAGKCAVQGQRQTLKKTESIMWAQEAPMSSNQERERKKKRKKERETKPQGLPLFITPYEQNVERGSVPALDLQCSHALSFQET